MTQSDVGGVRLPVPRVSISVDVLRSCGYFRTPAHPEISLILLTFLSLCVLLIGIFIPLWIIPDTFSKLSAGAFCVQFGVQG